jgi:uncharacterized protein YwgA
MNARDLVLLVLDAFGGETHGKTLLQKRCYFVALPSRWHREMGFDAHYYGPYSGEVDNAAGQLRALGFLQESRAAFGVIGEGGFEVGRYDYRLTPDGRRIADLRKKRDPASWEAIEAAVSKIRAAGDPNYVELSIAAKSYYLLEQRGGPASADELIQLAERFGWQITQEQVARAWDFLRELGLIRLIRDGA